MPDFVPRVWTRLTQDAIKDLNRSLEMQQHSDDEPEHTHELVDSDNSAQPNAAKLRGSVYILLNLLGLAQDEIDNSGTVEPVSPCRSFQS